MRVEDCGQSQSIDGDGLCHSDSQEGTARAAGRTPTRFRHRRRLATRPAAPLGQAEHSDKRPRFRKWSGGARELAISLTPRQAVLWLMNLDAISNLYQAGTGEPLSRGSQERLRQLLRVMAREDGIASRHH